MALSYSPPGVWLTAYYTPSSGIHRCIVMIACTYTLFQTTSAYPSRRPERSWESHWLFKKFFKTPLGMPESNIKPVTTGTRSQERKSDSETPSVSAPICTDHLLLLKILYDCYVGSFKVRGITNSSTVSICAPTLSSATACSVWFPHCTAQACIQTCHPNEE